MSDLMISEVEVLPIKPRNGLIAFASCIINDQLYLGSIAVHTCPTSEDGIRLVFPDKTLPTGKQINCYHPINREAGKAITKAIVEKIQSIKGVV